MPAEFDDDAAHVAELLALLDKGLTSAETNKQYLVNYRKAKKAARMRLKQTVADLEALRDQLKSQPRMLPWREVARVLIDARRLSETQKITLGAQVAEHRELMREMAQWVGINTPTMPLGAQCMTWRHVSLPRDPTTRRLAKDWITQQMLHNMERMFQRHEFPAWDVHESIDSEASFDFHDDAEYTAVLRRDYTHTLPLKDVVDFVHATLPIQCHIPHYDARLPLVEDFIEGATRHVVVVTSANECANVLFGESLTPDRYVTVVQQIQDDERYPVGSAHRQRNRMIWSETRKMQDGTFRDRILVLMSHLLPHQNESSVSLQADALSWGFNISNCPDHLQHVQFPKLWLDAHNHEIIAQERQFFASRKHNK
ncbi:Aste57867_21189 [Aphanomyces stellatus]|uniref:Aste57867_21189 protein n=1 Tax=Aphanomyces stellatus TaxID=120398 RepID=A0A485LIB4_9STRA|nr:hypothetical protein As57867_021121 [Aphanomyces stellatus]VFT97863.1 Aste57867_21189 [Aphanomyces stellatus]